MRIHAKAICGLDGFACGWRTTAQPRPLPDMWPGPGRCITSIPNHIVLYNQDAEINEEYTLAGRFEATEDLVSAVENNPVLEGWGNQIMVIRDGE